MNSMELIREQYFQNLIYTVGDWVKDVKTGVTGEVVKRGTNYITLVQEDFTLHKVWLEDVESMETQKKKLPEAVDFLKNRNLWEKLQREKRRDDEEGTLALAKKVKKLTPRPLFVLDNCIGASEEKVTEANPGPAVPPLLVARDCPAIPIGLSGSGNTFKKLVKVAIIRNLLQYY